MADSANAQIGKNVLLKFWDELVSSPPAYAVIGKLRSLAGTGAMKPEVDSTTTDSQAVERIGGLPDGKEITIVVTCTAASLSIAEQMFDSDDPFDFKIEFPSPLNLNRFMTVVILDYEIGTITASGLVELTLKGRITGGRPNATDLHI